MNHKNKIFFLKRALIYILIFSFVVGSFYVPQVSNIRNARAATFNMQTGYYVGTGAALSITGLGFQPNAVIIKADTAAGVGAVLKTSAMAAANTNYFTATAQDTSTLVTLDVDGFTLSTSANVNTSAVRYIWIAFSGSDCTSSGTFCVGSYTGDGQTTQAITSTGFQPDAVIIKSAGAASTVWRSSSMATNVGSYIGDVSANNTTSGLFTTLDAAGFTVGNLSNVNTSSTAYYYVAFKEVAGAMDVGTYVGNATPGRNIAGVGFVPDFVFTNGGGLPNLNPIFNITESSGDYSSTFIDQANLTNEIKALQSDGFQLGNGSGSNANVQTYYYAAFGGAVDPVPSGTFLYAAGQYTGTGSSKSITDLGFKPDLVIIKPVSADFGFYKTKMMPGTASRYFISASEATTAITSLDADGFTVGALGSINSTVHYYEAFGNAFDPYDNAGAVDFAVGSYTGNAQDSWNIEIRNGMQPNFVFIGPTGGPWFSTSAHPADNSSDFATGSLTTNIIQAFNSSGFQIGSSTNINVAGTLYPFVTFKSGDSFAVGTYTGTGSAHNETAVNFQPELVWVKRSVASAAVHRNAAMSGNVSQYFTATADTTNAITAFVLPGFSVGTAGEVNASGGVYYFVAWRTPSVSIARKIRLFQGFKIRLISGKIILRRW